MKVKNKAKEELIIELEQLRRRVADLELIENEYRCAEQAARDALEYAESLVATVREPLVVLDADLRVISASRSFYRTFRVTAKETEGRLLYELGDHQWDIPKLRELLETILPHQTSFDNYEVEHDFDTIGRRIMLLNARRIVRAIGKEGIILMAIEDATERKRLEQETEERRLYLESLLGQTHLSSAQHLEQVVLIPSSLQALGLGATLGCFLLLQQVQGNVS